MAEYGEPISTTLKHGQPTVVRPNRPLKFRIELTNGSYIEGVIPANSGLKVCDFGDIKKFDITADKDSLPKIEPVDD